MGRKKSVKELELQLQYARNKAAYTRPQREENATTQRRPKTPVKYAVLSPLAEADSAFTIQASAAGLQFFGGITALGLAAAGTDPAKPRGFYPAMIKAMVSDSSPTLLRATASKRPYMRYARGSRDSNVQNTFSAPVTADTPSNLDTRVKGLFTAIKPNLGGNYGRAWFEAEIYPLSTSG
ncbi:hypothetical protein H6G33_17895 [Calothrix sp. FACHB-1219]|uniref:hypothetical protein n=1 Tax=unclassified Calothrix TaxID=2619626 RepID=UPI001682C59B|nr:MULTISPECIES: hypothetical protein [unclassified Calothrix]MBD2202752.1 hypothetical protein [Calothrix sp. FACHB-168]MBD2218905.1 hypothetical protein [Calothrix sp. FACHB-1219]